MQNYDYIEIDFILTVGDTSNNFMHVIYDLECEPDELPKLCYEDLELSIMNEAAQNQGTINDWLTENNLLDEFKKGYKFLVTNIRT